MSRHKGAHIGAAIAPGGAAAEAPEKAPEGIPARFVNQRNDQLTPRWLIERVQAIGPIGLDVAGRGDGWVGARVELVDDEHGGAFSDEHGGGWRLLLRPGEIAWCNPPFGKLPGERRSQIYRWLESFVEEAERGMPGFFLSPYSARVEQPAYQRALRSKALSALVVPAGRVCFVDAESGRSMPSPQFPTILLAFGIHAPDVRRAFGDRAAVIPVDRPFRRWTSRELEWP